MEQSDVIPSARSTGNASPEVSLGLLLATVRSRVCVSYSFETCFASMSLGEANVRIRGGENPL
jgi:hypothetical protein